MATTQKPEDHATAVNDKGEVAVFIARSPVRPDGYRIDGRFLTVLSGRTEIGSYALEDVAYGAATARPLHDVLVVEMDEDGEVAEATPVRNVMPPGDR